LIADPRGAEGDFLLMLVAGSGVSRGRVRFDWAPECASDKGAGKQKTGPLRAGLNVISGGDERIRTAE
jgi:hypothetical protein